MVVIVSAREGWHGGGGVSFWVEGGGSGKRVDVICLGWHGGGGGSVWVGGCTLGQPSASRPLGGIQLLSDGSHCHCETPRAPPMFVSSRRSTLKPNPLQLAPPRLILH